MTSAPTGYLVCDGSAVSRTTYADLYTAIGDTFGAGDGSTTFNLPNLLGEFIRGYNGSGSGKDTGRSFGDQQDDAVSDHNHLMAKNNSTANGFANEGTSDFFGGSYYKYLAMSSGAGETGSAGGGVDNSNESAAMNFGVDEINDFKSGSSTTAELETRPTNVALLACIKT
jgi:microcystin-dependent protein